MDSASVLEFAPATGFVELSSPGTLRTGERFFVLDYHATAAEGGGQMGLWSGTSYQEGLEAARECQADGTRFVDRVAGEVGE